MRTCTACMCLALVLVCLSFSRVLFFFFVFFSSIKSLHSLSLSPYSSSSSLIFSCFVKIRFSRRLTDENRSTGAFVDIDACKCNQIRDGWWSWFYGLMTMEIAFHSSLLSSLLTRWWGAKDRIEKKRINTLAEILKYWLFVLDIRWLSFVLCKSNQLEVYERFLFVADSQSID